MNYSRLNRGQGLQEATTPPNPKGDDGVAFLAGKSTGGREDMTVLRRNLREGRRGDTQKWCPDAYTSTPYYITCILDSA